MSTLSASALKNPSSALDNIVLDNAGGAAFQQIKGGTLTFDTAKNTTSGPFVDFTLIPSWVKRITVLFNRVSTTGTVDLLLQLGVGSTPTTSGYLNGQSIFSWGSGILSSTSSAGIPIYNNAAAYTWTGRAVIERFSAASNNWVVTITLNNTVTSPSAVISSGVAVLSGALGMVRITTTTGTPTFDGGSMNLLYEG